MKHILFVLAIFITNSKLYSQTPTPPTVSIDCASGSPGCFSADPTIATYTYSATITNGDYTPANSWQRFIQWTVTGTTDSKSGEQTESLNVTWSNLPNSPTRKVKVTITYKKNNQQDVVVEAERTVVVKHIGPIISMTIPGASPSSPSNGGTTSVPCGTSGFTISVPTPTTDPSVGVTYNWSLPSGWSGSSTSNSISVTPNAGANDGVISVSAKRTDGNFFQSYAVNVTRPRVTNAIITSVSWSPDDKPLCNSETRQLSGASTLNATTFSWSTTGGTSITGASNQSTVTVSGTSNGTYFATHATELPQ